MLSDERLEEIRRKYSSDVYCEDLVIKELLAEIDRLRAASVPPAGAVKVRVAVAMSADGRHWVAEGWNHASDKNAMIAAMEDVPEVVPTGFITAYVMPPKPAEVTGEVEGL